MSEINEPPIADVIDLADFRSRVRPYGDVPSPFDVYQDLDYGAYFAARRALVLMDGPDAPENLMVKVRHSNGDSKVRSARTNHSWIYMVDWSKDELEALTIELQDQTEQQKERLSEPLRRLHLASILSHYVLLRDDRISYHSEISPPVIDEAVVKLDDDRERWENVTSWRIASGLGLLAVGRKRPELRSNIEAHLGEVLSNRLKYSIDKQMLATKVGVDYDGEEDITDFLLGVANPLPRFEIKTVLQKDADSNPRE